MSNQENPYRSPGGQYTAHPLKESRGSLVASWLTWIFRGGNRPARPNAQGEVVLQPSPLAEGIFSAAGLASPPVIFLLSTFYPPAAHERWAPCCIAGLCMLLGGIGWLSRETVTLTKAAIRKQGPFLQSQTLLWEDVVGMNFDGCRGVTLLQRIGRGISIPPELRGMPSLIGILRQRLPVDVHAQAESQLHRFEEFLGSRSVGAMPDESHP